MAIGTAVLLVVVAAALAQLRNAAPTRSPIPAQDRVVAAASVPQASGPQTSEPAGLQAFRKLGCSACHSINGFGNADMPLDGIGQRMDAATIRDWASGAGVARLQLPASLSRRKARAASDPQFELLVQWLSRGAGA